MPSGAGPPAGMLYLRPKSPSGPPGLWLAERMRPPSVLRARITAEAAGVDRMPFCPTSPRAAPFAAAIQVGRGAGRGGEWQYVWIAVVGGSIKKKIKRVQHNSI